MATATQTQGDAPTTARAPRKGSKPPVISFLVFEDNAGAHRWSVLDEAGARLAQSEPYGSPEEALAAAELVRGAAGSAQLDSAAAGS